MDFVKMVETKVLYLHRRKLIQAIGQISGERISLN